MALPYKRILLKISGEFFSPKGEELIKTLVGEFKKAQKNGLEIAIVLGGGNILRGKDSSLPRATADQMGMLATIINGLAFSAILDKANLKNALFCSFAVPSLVELFSLKKAQNALKEGKIVLLVGGTGHPYFTTDSAAALYALQLETDILLKGTKVDGIYDKDPSIKGAKRLKKISYNDFISHNLEAMDATAVALCKNKLPICLFDIFQKDGLKKALLGEIGTLVCQ